MEIEILKNIINIFQQQTIVFNGIFCIIIGLFWYHLWWRDMDKDSTKNDVNKSKVFKWIMIALLVGICVFLIIKGIQVRNANIEIARLIMELERQV